MASLVFFESIDKDWIPHSRGMFEVIFSALYELYLDKSKASTIRAELLPKVQGHLHHCWPDKYEEPGGIGLDFVEFSRFPLSERAEVSRATLNLLHDFLYDRIDPHLDWNWERRGDFISALRQFIALMREDIAASRHVRLVK